MSTFLGGFGTLDEFFEIVTLIQTHKMESVPVVCMGHDFWDPLHEWIRTSLVANYATVSPEDIDLYTTVDTAEEAFDLVKDSKERKYF
jgi:predicted Rossmann-fold nucleotide-binding protein